MWELDPKEGWVQKNWCFAVWVLEKTFENFLVIELLNLKGNQPRILIVRTHAEAEVQYFGHLMQRDDSLEKNLMLGKIEGKRRSGGKRIWLDSITDSVDTNLSKLQEIVKDREDWHATVHGVIGLDMTVIE